MAQQRSATSTVERNAAAAYLASMLEELMPLAQSNGLPVVAYLLDMALTEARAAMSKSTEHLDGSR